MDQESVEVGGTSVPKLGLGTWRLEGKDCYRAVSTALEVGYRHVDTAAAYGNERQVGRAIADADVDREEVFLTTKVLPVNATDYDSVREAARGSLDRLGVEYVDLLLLHWPNPLANHSGQLRALSDLREEGLIEHVGVSNYSRRRLRRAREVSPGPILTDQVEFHPFHPQRPLLRYCQDNDLLLTAYSPLAHGGVLRDRLLSDVGNRYGKSAAQVALRWATQHRNVAVIPKATSREHIEENFAVFDFSLTESELDRIARKSTLRRVVSWGRGRTGV
ncbi:aldehyde oxidoreductase [Halobacteriales archaeon QS_8_69_26]|nr:MAG: aldehyde oxidoreductase [Halobacteriales archaeon QS_8_69_26]